jgi:energy-converting hydrogenase Eha subunit E
MHLALFADFLGLGHSLSAFGYTLALILTWFVAVPALATFLIAYAVIAVLAERRENQARIRAWDQAHTS